jgi:hypothetical protein
VTRSQVLCECGHPAGDHRHVTTGNLTVLIGVCLAANCKCPEFIEKGDE